MIPAAILGVLVFCGGPSTYYDPGAAVVHVGAYECAQLAQAPRVRDEWSAAVAVFDLGHELGHAHDAAIGAEASAGECNRAGKCEAVADCYGAGHMIATARAVGFSRRQARRLQKRAASSGLGYAPIAPSCWIQAP